MDDQVIRLVLQADTSGVKDADAAVRQYIDSLTGVGQASAAAGDGAARVKQGMATVRDEVAETARSSKQGAMALNQFAYGIEDFAAGYRINGFRGAAQAISNNVQMIGMNLGLGTAGILGITAAAVALPAVIPPLAEAIRRATTSFDASQLESYESVLKRVTKAYDDVGKSAGNARLAVDNMFATPDEARAVDAARARLKGPDGAKIKDRLEAVAIEQTLASNEVLSKERHDLGSDRRNLSLALLNEANLQEERVRTSTPGNTYSYSRTLEIDRRLAHYRREIPGLRQSIAEHTNTLEKARPDLEKRAFGQLQERLTRMAPEDRKWVADSLRGEGMEITADDFAALNPEDMREAREARRESEDRLLRPLTDASGALEMGRRGLEQVAQRGLAWSQRVAREDREQKAGERERKKAEREQGEEEQLEEQVINEAHQRDAARLREQQEALRFRGEEEDLGYDAQRAGRHQEQFNATLRQMLQMGANAMQIQEALGDEQLQIRQEIGDILQRQEALRIRKQQARQTHQRVFGGG